MGSLLLEYGVWCVGGIGSKFCVSPRMLAREFLTLFALSHFDKFSDSEFKKLAFSGLVCGGRWQVVYNRCERGPDLCIIVAGA